MKNTISNKLNRLLTGFHKDEKNCEKFLALYNPVAIDLRYVIAILKINNDLERVGDLAVNIAERVVYLAKKPPLDECV